MRTGSENSYICIGKLITVLLCLIPLSNLQSSHIIGAEISFSCLGDDQYEITLYIFRDCRPGTYRFDNPALINVYNSQNQFASHIGNGGSISLPLLEVDQIIPNLPDSCQVLPPFFCVEVGFYQTTVTMPFLAGGYQLAYGRCCRNSPITNIGSGANATYVTYISERALEDCYEGVRFQEYPEPVICVNSPISYDHSLIGAESDSVVYKLCNPLTDGNVPPFNTVNWLEPTYSLNNKLGGPDSLKIDPQTGLLTGTPSIIGRFVVGVCAEVYRDGELITSMNRDFQYNVGACGYTIADFETLGNYCLQRVIEFENQSVNSYEAHWIWSQMGTPLDTSSDYNATFAPNGPGTYDVTLIAIGNLPECNDTLSRTVTVLDLEYDLEVTVEYGECNDSIEIRLFGEVITVLDGENIYSWSASWGDVVKAGTDSSFVLYVSDDRHVNISFLARNKEVECWSNRLLNLETGLIFEDGEELHHFICKGNTLYLNPEFNGTNQYFWTPAEGLLDSQNSINPLAMPLETTTYTANLSTEVCTGEFTVEVEVFDQSIHSSPDTICGSGEFTFLSPWGDESSLVAWRFYRNGAFLGSRIGVEVNYNFHTPGDWLIEVIARDPVHRNCKDTLLIPLFLVDQTLSLEGHITGSGNCLDTVEAVVTAHLQGQDFSPDHYLWLIHGDTIVTENPTLNFPFMGTGELGLVLLVPNNLGCELREELVLLPDLINEVYIRDSIHHCYGDTLIIQSGLPSDFSFSWTPDTYFLTEAHLPNPLAMPVNDINYSASIEKGNCKVFYDLNVQVTNHLLDLPDVNLCDTLQAVIEVEEKEGLEYHWEVGNLSDSILSDGGGEVLLIAEIHGLYPIGLNIFDPLSGCSFSMHSELRLVDTELFDIEIDPVILDCSEPLIVEFNAVSPGDSASPFSFIWHISGDTSFSLVGENIVSQLPESQILVELTGTDQYGCSRTINKELKLEAIKGNFGPDTLFICPGDTVHLNPDFNSEYDYLWSPATGMIDLLTSHNPAVSPDESQWYVGEISNEFCKRTKSVWVEVLPAPAIFGIYASPNPILRFSENSYLNLDFWPPDASVEWRPPQYLDNADVPNPVAAVDYTTTFTATITTSDGCSTSKTIEVVVNDLPCDEPYVYLPNAFSPNGDGENDVLYLRGEQVEKMELMIYDRWGQRVFYSTSLENGWDGTFKGQPLPAGSYPFYLDASCFSGERTVKRGHVFLVR